MCAPLCICGAPWSVRGFILRNDYQLKRPSNARWDRTTLFFWHSRCPRIHLRLSSFSQRYSLDLRNCSMFHLASRDAQLNLVAQCVFRAQWHGNNCVKRHQLQVDILLSLCVLLCVCVRFSDRILCKGVVVGWEERGGWCSKKIAPCGRAIKCGNWCYCWVLHPVEIYRTVGLTSKCWAHAWVHSIIVIRCSIPIIIMQTKQIIWSDSRPWSSKKPPCIFGTQRVVCWLRYLGVWG